jgi:hypothetical protein
MRLSCFQPANVMQFKGERWQGFGDVIDGNVGLPIGNENCKRGLSLRRLPSQG